MYIVSVEVPIINFDSDRPSAILAGKTKYLAKLSSGIYGWVDELSYPNCYLYQYEIDEIKQEGTWQYYHVKIEKVEDIN